MINKEVNNKKEINEKKKPVQPNVDLATGSAMDHIIIRDKTTNKIILNKRG